MSNGSEPRMTEQAQPAKRKVGRPRSTASDADAENSRHGMDELPRADAHFDDGRDDERESLLDGRELTDEEYLAMFRDSINQSVLPDLPTIRGFHTFWATTNNPRDTITNRMRMGYRLIRADELPGWDGGAVKSGDYAGCVGLNEMIAMKIPERLYQLYMQEAHHRMPLAEEEKIRHTVQQHSESALRDKGKIVDEDGLADNIVQKAPVPVFA